MKFSSPYILVFLSVLIISCSKENEEIQKMDTKIFGYIVAGDKNSENVIYTDIADTNIHISTSSTYIKSNGLYIVDINLDGIDDFKFTVEAGGGLGMQWTTCEISCLDSNKIFFDSNETYLTQISPARLILGDSINHNSPLIRINQLEMSSYTTSMGNSNYYGPWLNISDKYIGFKIYSEKKSYFGWIRVDVLSYPSLIIKDYAYRL